MVLVCDEKTVHVGDTGTVLEYTIHDGGVILDVSAATTMDLVVLDGGGNRSVLAGVFATDGTDGRIDFTSISDTWEIPGTGKEQIFLVLPTGQWSSCVFCRNINDIL